VQGRCGERLTCRVVDTDASVMWSGMRRSESTRDAHLTPSKAKVPSKPTLMVIATWLVKR